MPTNEQISRIRRVYVAPETEIDRTVYRAICAVQDGECSSAVVLLGVENLIASAEQRHSLPDYQRAEQYLVECWREHATN